MSLTPSERPDLRRRIRRRLYPQEGHPFQLYSRLVNQHAQQAERVLDVGCGHRAPDLESIKSAARKVGVDIDPQLYTASAPTVEFVRATSDELPFCDDAFDLIISKSVLEHLATPRSSFQEFRRVMRPGGHFILLTPNRWDYVSILSTLVPNRFHPWVVRTMTGRSEADTFPTHYRANTGGQIRRLAKAARLEVASIVHCREHPHYLKFSTPTYLAGVAFEQAIQRPIFVLRPWLLAVLVRPL